MNQESGNNSQVNHNSVNQGPVGGGASVDHRASENGSASASPHTASPHSTAPSHTTRGKEEKSQPERNEILSFFKTLAIFLLVAFMLRTAVVEAYKIPSLSMYPTLRIGDYILVSKFTYGLRLPFLTHSVAQFATPDRGDIVVFTRPDDPTTLDDESSISIIKRVMGLPGDTVEVRKRALYINGERIAESYANWDNWGNPEGEFAPQVVPAGHVFLLGDNRDHSRDSRFWHKPFLDIGRIKGKALIIYWSTHSLNRIGTVLR